jgi:hypothetical protein
MFAHTIRLNSFHIILPEVMKHRDGKGMPVPVLRRAEEILKARDGSHFKRFLEKAIYKEEHSTSEFVKKYSVYIPKPGSPSEVLGPYFSFSLTLAKNETHRLDPKYLDSSTGTISDAYSREIARLTAELIDLEIRKCPELMKVQNGITLAEYEKQNTFDLTPEEIRTLDDTLARLKATEEMLLNTKVLPALTIQARVEYIQRKQPTFPQELILAVIEELHLH